MIVDNVVVNLPAVRLAAAVHETLSPFMKEMLKHLAEVKENLTSVQGQVNSLTKTLAKEVERNVLKNVTKELKKAADYVLERSHTYHCDGTEGWRRVLYLNMTDPNTNCPSGWQLTSNSKTTCGRVNTSSLSCDSVFFPVSGGNYTSVCGSIRAYQYGAFEPYHNGLVTTINGAYVCGVSLTHGSPRQHIWTFAAGISEYDPTRNDACPCDTSINTTIPAFVDRDYFCESGVNSKFPDPGIFYPNDPLWDGQSCNSDSSCCSLNNPPYFAKKLPSPTFDPIEARLCRSDRSATAEDSPVEVMELYVK